MENKLKLAETLLLRWLQKTESQWESNRDSLRDETVTFLNGLTSADLGGDDTKPRYDSEYEKFAEDIGR